MAQLATNINNEVVARIPATPPADPADLLDGPDLLAIFAKVVAAVAALELVARGARILRTAGVPSNINDGENGDLAINLATTDLYAKDGGVWVGLGFRLKGDKGDTGTGTAGLSAYQVALATGFQGSEAQWVASLGKKGDAGKSAYQVAVDGGFMGNVAAWLESLKVKGDTGAAGNVIRWASFAPTNQDGQVGDMWVENISSSKYALHRCTASANGVGTWQLRFTSPDSSASGGTGGTAGVTSFNTRTGAVTFGVADLAAVVQAGANVVLSQQGGKLVLSTQVVTPTGTVLHFNQDADYPNIATGTFTVDLTDAVVGKVVFVRLEAGATAPTLPAGFVLLSGTHTADHRNKYSFCVAPDGSIEYYITQLP